MKYKREKRCRRCGACCSDLQPVTSGEIEMLKAYAMKHRIKERKNRLDKCPFLRRHKCAVYKIRPAICRIYSCTKPEQEVLTEYHREIGITIPRSIRKEIYYA